MQATEFFFQLKLQKDMFLVLRIISVFFRMEVVISSNHMYSV